MSEATDVRLQAILRDLVAFKTVTGSHQAVGDLYQYVSNFLAPYNFQIERLVLNGYESLLATTKGTKTPKLLLSAHVDVVPAPDSAFTLTEVGMRYHGRGVFDMKFALAAYLRLVEELGDGCTSHDFGILLTADEEIGGHDGMGYVVEQGVLPSVVIIPDGGDNWQLEYRAKGAWFVELTASGTSSHGSRPWEGDNAIDKLVHVLEAAKGLCPDPSPETDSLTISQIHGGEAMNQAPDSATATLDIRYLEAADRDNLEIRLREIASEHDTIVTTKSEVAPHLTDVENPLVKSFMEIVGRVRGHPMQTTASNGASDARFFDPHNIPVIVFRPLGGNAHAADEWIESTGLQTMVTVLRRYLEQVA